VTTLTDKLKKRIKQAISNHMKMGHSKEEAVNKTVELFQEANPEYVEHVADRIYRKKGRRKPKGEGRGKSRRGGLRKPEMMEASEEDDSKAEDPHGRKFGEMLKDAGFGEDPREPVSHSGKIPTSTSRQWDKSFDEAESSVDLSKVRDVSEGEVNSLEAKFQRELEEKENIKDKLAYLETKIQRAADENDIQALLNTIAKQDEDLSSGDRRGLMKRVRSKEERMGKPEGIHRKLGRGASNLGRKVSHGVDEASETGARANESTKIFRELKDMAKSGVDEKIVGERMNKAMENGKLSKHHASKLSEKFPNLHGKGFTAFGKGAELIGKPWRKAKREVKNKSGVGGDGECPRCGSDIIISVEEIPKVLGISVQEAADLSMGGTGEKDDLKKKAKEGEGGDESSSSEGDKQEADVDKGGEDSTEAGDDNGE